MGTKKIRNVSGVDRVVPGLNGRLVLAGSLVDVPEDVADQYLCQPDNWADGTPETPVVVTVDNDPQEG